MAIGEPRAIAALAAQARRRARRRSGVRQRSLAAADGQLRTHAGAGRHRCRGRAQASMSFSLHFLGVGSAQAVELGSSGAVLERDGAPLLLIDCGPETLARYVELYDAPPPAVYITHTHM